MPDCAFCDRATLRGILHQTEHFVLLADHAPLVEGHLLIIPHEHFACYGAVPAALELEWLDLKRTVAAFLGQRYRTPLFFEHGIFRQTVYHAHLHAIPLGADGFRVDELLAHGGRRVGAPEDVRAWYAEHGPYYYIEQPGTPGDGQTASAAVFPPELDRYFKALNMLRNGAGRVETWAPQPLRRLVSGSKVASLTTAWPEYAGGEGNEEREEREAGAMDAKRRDGEG